MKIGMKIHEEGEKICSSNHNLLMATFQVNRLNKNNNADKEDISVYKMNEANKEKFIQEVKKI